MNQTQPRGIRTVLRATAGGRVAELQARYLADDPTTVATLARLRRCDPADVGAEPLVWAVTLGDLPEELTNVSGRRSEQPTAAERALHATLVLYALHQQSGEVGAHAPGVSLGLAVGRLARARAIDEEFDSATIKRLHITALATDLRGHLHHLRGLIQLMRAEKQTIGLDHGLLAVDLWQLADARQDSREVLARWGRDLHSRPKTTDPTTSEEPK